MLRLHQRPHVILRFDEPKNQYVITNNEIVMAWSVNSVYSAEGVHVRKVSALRNILIDLERYVTRNEWKSVRRQWWQEWRRAWREIDKTTQDPQVVRELEIVYRTAMESMPYERDSGRKP